ncbi:MAG: class I SAM-dependent methyltransferase [Planctomycetota bacterium]
MDDYTETNRQRWDELVPIHLRSAFYDVDGFRNGACSLMPPELEAVGDPRGLRLLHLQCHFGLDTLSWARRGAIVTGVDFSAPAVDAAKALAAETGIDARFVCADVLALGDALDDSFDLVFASYGALTWIGDLRGWMKVAQRFLRPGGRLCVVELHPQAFTLAAAQAPSDPTALLPADTYFATAAPYRDDEASTYADRSAVVEQREHYFWPWNLGDVVTAAAAAGLTIERLTELPRAHYPVFSFLEPDGGGAYRLRGGVDAVPLTYVLLARRRFAD